MTLKNMIWIVTLIFHFNLYAQTTGGDLFKVGKKIVEIKPILHGSLVLNIGDKTIYVDPYGGPEKYADQKTPDIILITDTHGDHLHSKTLEGIDTSKALFIVPQAVADQLNEKYTSSTTVLNNGQGIHRYGLFIKAVPMYNLPEESDSRHPKGRGNGYVVRLDDFQIYISGDTEDIPEMRMLENIDLAFVCMNLPYTMDIKQAANAVLDFKPKVVYPYHYRGSGGLSDVEGFKKLVMAKNGEIEIRLRNWYKD